MDKKNTKEDEEGGETPMQALTDDQVEEIREVLSRYKTDNKVGMISQLDACDAMYCLGIYRTEAEVTQMFAEFELEPYEFISEEQFLSVMTKSYQQMYDKESLLAAFDVFDEDRNKFINPSELRLIALNLGANYTDEEFEDMFREVDFDNDGRIGYADFVRAVTKP